MDLRFSSEVTLRWNSAPSKPKILFYLPGVVKSVAAENAPPPPDNLARNVPGKMPGTLDSNWHEPRAVEGIGGPA
jgi:hypothetical protein